jgi:hypothetical protein
MRGPRASEPRVLARATMSGRWSTASSPRRRVCHVGRRQKTAPWGGAGARRGGGLVHLSDRHVPLRGQDDVRAPWVSSNPPEGPAEPRPTSYWPSPRPSFASAPLMRVDPIERGDEVLVEE